MKNLYSSGALVVLAVLFIVLTMLSSIVFKGWRLDLTENNLYTLSEGTVNIAESLDQKVRLRLYFSDSASEDLPQIRSYAERVWELMQELAAQSDGMIELERIDPEPFSEAEDDAARYGLEAVPLNQAGDVLYLGVVGTNAVDGLEVLPFLSPNRESLLEYDLARMVATLATPDLPRVGLITGLQLSGGFDMQTGQRTPSWAVFDQWSELFDLTTIPTTGESGATGLPPDLDALVVVHPKNLSEDLMFAIDQFVLGGGRLLAFVDPYAEADPGENPNDPASRFMAERASTLAPLFEAWGYRTVRSRPGPGVAGHGPAGPAAGAASGDPGADRSGPQRPRHCHGQPEHGQRRQRRRPGRHRSRQRAGHRAVDAVQ